MTKVIWPIFALLALAACDTSSSNSNVRIVTKDNEPGSALKVIDSLQCPNDQGVLTRRGSASDGGQTCTYVGPRGAEVKLHLVNIGNDSSTVILTRYARELDLGKKPQGGDIVVSSETSEETDTAQVRMPGMSIDSSGDKATVALPGIKIEADGDKANIRIGGLVIRADDKTSEMITDDGQGTAVFKADDNSAIIQTSSNKAIRATMMNVSAQPNAEGWRVVGYEARGPHGGPIVVATFRSRDRDSDDIIEAAKALVTLNVGD